MSGKYLGKAATEHKELSVKTKSKMLADVSWCKCQRKKGKKTQNIGFIRPKMELLNPTTTE